MTSKGITLLSQTRIFNDDIIERRRKSADLKTWEKYKLFFYQSHREQERAVTTAGKGGYTATVKNLRCTTALSRRAPWGDLRHINCAGNANTRLQAIRTCISQCSHYQLELRGIGTVETYDCDHENHVGAFQNKKPKLPQEFPYPWTQSVYEKNN